MARMAMCIDCNKFGTDNCKMKDKVDYNTPTIMLLHTDCDGSENLFHKVDGRYVCKKCGEPKTHNEHGCKCVLKGEYEYLRYRGVK